MNSEQQQGQPGCEGGRIFREEGVVSRPYAGGLQQIRANIALGLHGRVHIGTDV